MLCGSHWHTLRKLFGYTYLRNLKSSKPHEIKTKNIELLHLLMKNWKPRIWCLQYVNRKAFGESFLYWVDFTDSFFNPKKFCQTDWTLWTPRIILSKVMLKLLKLWQLSCLRGDTVLSTTAHLQQFILAGSWNKKN